MGIGQQETEDQGMKTVVDLCKVMAQQPEFLVDVDLLEGQLALIGHLLGPSGPEGNQARDGLEGIDNFLSALRAAIRHYQRGT
jgi:hypothetical protein